MKLYTEDQVRDLLRQVWTYTPTQIDNLIDIMEPIELPSDEEIEKLSRYKPTENVPYNPLLNLVWIEGAKSMRDKIQGGNNEQRKKH